MLHKLSHIFVRFFSKEESEEPPKEKTAITLAEMFDQIRNCRYIRHYYPDGTTMDEYTD